MDAAADRMTANHISGRPDVGDVRLQLVVDFHQSALVELNVDVFKSCLVSVWLSPSRHQQLLAAEGFVPFAHDPYARGDEPVGLALTMLPPTHDPYARGDELQQRSLG